MRRGTPSLAIAAAIAVVLLCPRARAESDHLAGIVVKDMDKIQPPATYTIDTDAGSLNCELKKAKILLMNAEKNGGDDPRGADAGKFVCYTAKCSAPSDGITVADDQFGTHSLARKKVKMICAPMLEQACGNDNVEGSEQCDGTDDGACPGACSSDCTCGATPKIVFVTSTLHMGNWGGVSGADAICQNRAAAAGLSGSYFAWIATDSVSPSTRFVQSTAPYILVNDTVVADNWSDLTDGTLDVPIDVDELGATVAPSNVWTAATTSGTYSGSGCSNWTSSAVVGLAGSTGSADSSWTSIGSRPCAESNRIYCVQQ